MRAIALMLTVAGIAPLAPATAASDKFAFEYRVERADAGRLSIPACLATAQRASAQLGYVPMTAKTYPGQLAVFAAGPRGGGGSLTVYCIAVERKTAFVVQALDYSRPQSVAAKRAADAVHQALLQAGR